MRAPTNQPTTGDAALPNPFLSDTIVVSETRKPGPPGRPPPPVSASPAHAPAAPKSAFDDLNDSIQLALGNSPAKQAQATTGGIGIGGGGGGGGGIAYQQAQSGGIPHQTMPVAAPNYGIVPQQQQVFSSPSNQPPTGLL